MADWHVTRDGEAMGPMPAAQVREMLGSGELDGETLVWTEGMRNWQPLAETPELTAPPQQAPPDDAAPRIERPRIAKREKIVWGTVAAVSLLLFFGLGYYFVGGGSLGGSGAGNGEEAPFEVTVGMTYVADEALAAGRTPATLATAIEVLNARDMDRINEMTRTKDVVRLDPGTRFTVSRLDEGLAELSIAGLADSYWIHAGWLSAANVPKRELTRFQRDLRNVKVADVIRHFEHNGLKGEFLSQIVGNIGAAEGGTYHGASFSVGIYRFEDPALALQVQDTWGVGDELHVKGPFLFAIRRGAERVRPLLATL